jgi:ceramide glucosyltransferase
VLSLVAGIAAALAGIGLGQAIAGAALVTRFAARPLRAAVDCPKVTVLKPLHGDEPLLEAALASVCAQDYPHWQVVCGVQDPADPAIAVVRRLQARFPACNLVLVVDPTQHGPNRKIGNLINMLPAAKHDVLVIADSDMHVRPDYLVRLVASLEPQGVGLVTTLYAGLPADRGLPALLGALQITHGFLPGALLARAMGREDCLGATMCLRRDILARIGGLPALVHHLADDNVLGQRVRALGLRVALADTVVATTVPEASLAALFRHELRWARTIRALVPGAFAASILQYRLFWAALAVLASLGAAWAWALFLVAWATGALAALQIDRALRARLPALAFPCPVWLLPLRDLLSVAVMLASYVGTRVDWRGHTLHSDQRPSPPVARPRLRPDEGLNPP